MLFKILGIFLIGGSALLAYAAWVIAASPPVMPEDVVLATRGTTLLGIGAATLFLSGMLALLRR